MYYTSIFQKLFHQSWKLITRPCILFNECPRITFGWMLLIVSVFARNFASSSCVALHNINMASGVYDRARQSFIRRCKLCNVTLVHLFDHLLWAFRWSARDWTTYDFAKYLFFTVESSTWTIYTFPTLWVICDGRFYFKYCSSCLVISYLQLYFKQITKTA